MKKCINIIRCHNWNSIKNDHFQSLFILTSHSQKFLLILETFFHDDELFVMNRREHDNDEEEYTYFQMTTNFYTL